MTREFNFISEPESPPRTRPLGLAVLVSAGLAVLLVSCVSVPIVHLATSASATHTPSLTPIINAQATGHSMPTASMTPTATNSPTLLPGTAQPNPRDYDCRPAPSFREAAVYGDLLNASDVQITASYAYVTDSAGLHIFDTSDPLNASQVGFWRNEGGYRQVVTRAENAFLLSEEGLDVIDVSNPSAPFKTGFLALPGQPMEILLNERDAVIRDNIGVLHILDLSEPTRPLETGFYDPPGTILGGQSYGNQVFAMRARARMNRLPSFSIIHGFVYLADLDGGLKVLDISRRGPPSVAASINMPELPSNIISLAGDAYVFSIEDSDSLSWGLWRLRLRNGLPEGNPVKIGRVFQRGHTVEEFTCQFLREFYEEMRAVGLEDLLLLPTPLAIADLMQGLATEGTYLLLADPDRGLIVLVVQCAAYQL